MSEFNESWLTSHEHIFLGAGHDANERKTWAVIALCGVMMVVEIVGGSFFGSLALVADGVHMSTHASAMLIAALAYTYARKHANDSRQRFPICLRHRQTRRSRRLLERSNPCHDRVADRV